MHINGSTEKILRLVNLLPLSCDIILDVGAHSGLFSHLAKRRCPNARVIAFEANLDLLETLKRNSLPGIDLVLKAVGARTGNVEFFVNPKSTQTSSAVEDSVSVFAASATLDRRTVPIVTLDSFCEQQGVTKVDCLKIDVQGYERDVIRGAQRILASVKLLLLEASFLDRTSVELIFQLRGQFAFAYAINDVYLGSDIALTRVKLENPMLYISRVW